MCRILPSCSLTHKKPIRSPALRDGYSSGSAAEIWQERMIHLAHPTAPLPAHPKVGTTISFGSLSIVVFLEYALDTRSPDTGPGTETANPLRSARQMHRTSEASPDVSFPCSPMRSWERKPAWPGRRRTFCTARALPPDVVNLETWERVHEAAT